MLAVTKINFKDIDVWEKLMKKSSTSSFFQHPLWLNLWVKHFGKSEEVKVLEIKKGKKVIGIVPLLIKNNMINLLGTTPVLGGELVSDYGDIIAKISYEKIVCKEVLVKVKSQKSKFKIIVDFIREDSPSFRALNKLGGEVKEVDVAPFVDLPDAWDEYLVSLSRKNRHELKRKMRRLEKEGRFKVFCNNSGLDEKNIDEFFRLMSLSGRKKGSFLTNKMKAFFKDIYQTFLPKGMLELCFLSFGRVNIASTLSFLYNNEVLLYNSGFDPEYKNLSPGLLLTAFGIKRAIERGKSRYDFLKGRERYKYNLGGKDRKLYKILL